MAEETVKVPEAVVIPYGQESIDYNKFLTNAADSVLSYVDKLPWSKKRKEYFWQAYNDLMNKGITGASNDTGVWTVNHKGDAVPLESLPKKLLEMYGEAAYFIQQLMSKIPVLVKEDEEKKKADLLLFDNDYFTNSFNKHIGNKLFGGQKWDTQKHWNVLDERGENGLRGRRNRANKLAEMLQSYSDSLKENSYNFEGTAFNDLSDLKNRINIAINALKTESPDDDRDALNQLGLDADVYFNDGSGDLTVDANGNPITYGELYKQNQELAKKRAAEEQQKLAALRRANAGVLNFIGGIHGTDAATNPLAYSEYISQRLGTGLLGYNAMNAAVQNLINAAATNTLDSAGRRQLGNFLYYIRTNNPNYQKSNITDLEWAELNTHKNLKSANRAGFVRLPWQTSEGRYTYADDKGNLYFLKPANLLKFNAPAILRSAAYNNYKNNFLSNTKAGEKLALEKYLNSTEFNDADIAELTGIGLDIASIVDPEPISAAIAGVGAAGARNYARTRGPEKWGVWDYVGQGVDYVTGAIGAIPGLGDAALAAKTVKNIAKWGKRALTIPAVYDMLSHSPGALTAVKKAVAGEDLSVQDYKNLGSFIRGFASTRRITVLNRAARRAMEKRGYDVSNQNSWLKRSGLVDTSLPKLLATVKVNIKKADGKTETKEIPISNKKNLERELRKAGNDLAAKDKAVRETPEVKEYITKNNIKEEDLSAISSKHWRNSKYTGLTKFVRTTKENFESKPTEGPTKEDTFEQYVTGDRSLWDRYKYGSERTLRAFDPGKGVPKGATTEEQKTTESKEKNTTKKEDQIPVNKYHKFIEYGERPTEINPGRLSANRTIMKSYKAILEGKFSKKNMSTDSYKLGDETIYTYTTTADGKPNISIHTSEGRHNFTSLKEAKLFIAKLVKELKNKIVKGSINQKNVKEIGRVLADLRRKGWLKQGGQINKSAELIIIDFINNLK